MVITGPLGLPALKLKGDNYESDFLVFLDGEFK